ncbi:hypothetical protein MHU86_12070 [Fragilaria crotonensis]|nr:hypothetical protein MHU86_12070 [Fragilaria crotonensis]
MSGKDLTSEMLREVDSEAESTAASETVTNAETTLMIGRMENSDSLVSSSSEANARAETSQMPPVELDGDADLAASALALSNLASADPMQGLEVMAKAAGEAVPHNASTPEVIHKLIEGDVDVVVPVPSTPTKVSTLASVYKFDGINELAGQLNHGQKRGIIAAYIRGLDVGFVEQNLPPFRNWFKHFRFAEAIFKPGDIGNKMWHFRHVLLGPQCVENISFGTAPKNFLTCARQFYTEIFHPSPSMEEQIDRAMKQDITIMMLALRVAKKGVLPKSLTPYASSLITVSAVTFQLHRDPNDHGAMSVFVSFLGVTHHLTAHPPSITSWRRNGVGLFMMVQVIKRCASIKDVKTIEVFLQCSEPSAFHFYTMIGFRQLNKSEADDGFKMLPLHLQTALKSQTPSSFLRSTNDSKHPMLMHLRHGELNYRNSANAAKDKEDDEDTVNVEPRTQPFWCQYPPPLLIGGGRFVYDRKDADNLFMSLPLLRKLLPGPLEPLLPANSLFLKGEMTLVRRKQHSESEGTQWFSSGEINLMLSILTCDGRYEDATFILSVYFGSVLKKGFAAHASYKALLQLEKDNASMDEKELEALVQKILGTGSKQIKRTQQVQQDFVVHEIIERNPGLLSKQVLVFPQNEDGEHWSVTFVFNPGYIRDNVGDIENADNSPKPFFFRYCSKYPFGTRDVSIDTGIIWFLNLSYSTKVYQESMPAQGAAMRWCSPFGKTSQGNMLGTKSFPALRLPEANLLPRQDDGWNCGVGVVAAVGIILRNVCTQKVERMNFDEQFGPQKNWELHQDNITKEWFAYFDRRFLNHSRRKTTT